MFNDFEKVFKWCDYAFKFTAWNVLMGALLYVGAKRNNPSLIVICNLLSLVSSVAVSAFFADIVVFLIRKKIDDRRITAALFAAVWIFILPLLVFGQMLFVDRMVALASSK